MGDFTAKAKNDAIRQALGGETVKDALSVEAPPPPAPVPSRNGAADPVVAYLEEQNEKLRADVAALQEILALFVSHARAIHEIARQIMPEEENGQHTDG